MIFVHDSLAVPYLFGFVRCLALEKALSSIARCTGAGAVATADQGASTPSRVSTGSKPGNRPAIGNREESPPPDLSERLKQWVGIGGSSGGAPADLSA